MTKTIFVFFICLSSIGISFSQIKLDGRVYSDSTLTIPLSKVKLILKSNDSQKVYYSDKYGNFNISLENRNAEYSLEIKKKDYITVTIDKISKDLKFDVILRKVSSIHDEEYQGTSKLIIRD